MEHKDKKDQYKKQNKWITQKYDRINLLIPKGQKAIIQECAKENNMSMTQFIVRAIDDKLSEHMEESTQTSKLYPCDGPEGFCPFDAEGGMDCRNYCGLGVDESGDDDDYDEEE